MKSILLAAICVLPSLGAELPWTPAAEKSYFQHAFGIASYKRAAISTVLAEITNNPREWGRTWDGAGKRFASAYGRHLISTSVRYSVATLRHEDARYFPSAETAFKGRLKHALLGTVRARHEDTGASMFALGRVSGAYAGGFVSRTWMPDRFHTFSSGIRSGTMSLGLDAAMNVMREFWPRKRNHPVASPPVH